MLPWILIFTAAAVFAMWFCMAWISAELPKKGTLEWIFGYERPRFSVRPAHRLTVGDLFWWLIPAAVTAATVAAEMVFTTGLGNAALFVFNILPPAFAAVAVYFLSKSMTGSVLPSLAAGCLTALAALLIGEGTVLLAVTIFAAWLWFAGGAWWLLALSGAAFATATVLDVWLSPLAAVLLILALIGAWQRVAADRIGFFGAVLTVLLPFAAAAVTIPLAFTPAALSFGMGFPQCYARADFWGMIVGYYAADFPMMLFGGVYPWSIVYAMMRNLPCVTLTVCGLVAPLVQFLRRKSGAELFLWLWCVAAAALYLFNVDVTVITGAMVLAFGTSRLIRRGHPVRAAFAAAIPLLASIALVTSVVLAYRSIL